MASAFAAVQTAVFAPFAGRGSAAARPRRPRYVADHRGGLDLGLPGHPRLDRQPDPVRDDGQLRRRVDSGRTFFAGGQVDWAASEIPYGVEDGTNYDPPPDRGYDYMPDVAGGTTLMYNLNIDGKRVKNLRLSGSTVAGIFTNKITMWNDPAIKADNPGLNLPALADHPGRPLRRLGRHRGLHPVDARDRCRRPGQAYCQAVGRAPCTQTSVYPTQVGTT